MFEPGQFVEVFRANRYGLWGDIMPFKSKMEWTRGVIVAMVQTPYKKRIRVEGNYL